MENATGLRVRQEWLELKVDSYGAIIEDRLGAAEVHTLSSEVSEETLESLSGGG